MIYLPDYHNGSIVNLMSSLLHAFGAGSQYKPLSLLPPSSLAGKTNVVLMILDGFGYEYLLRQEPNTVCHAFLKGKMTSVFPSTTASAITTFLTGLAPQQHAVTGWFMHLKEFGSVAISLYFQPRCGEISYQKDGISPGIIYHENRVFTQMRRHTYAVHQQHLMKTDYSTGMMHGAQKEGYRTFPGFFRTITKTIMRSPHEKKFIYAYWDRLDELCHKHGTRSPEVTAHYRELMQHLAAFVESIRHTDTTLIITADHGLIDAEPAKTIEVKAHPELRETLVLPLCGESRVAYCYVRPFKTVQFEKYITRHFEGICDLHRSSELIEQHYFGLFETDQRLYDRVGDYTLVMRENYVIKDFLLGEKEKFHIGNHGGVSKEEMFVPLIVIEA